MAGRITLRLALLAIFLNSRLFVAADTAGDDFTNNLFTDLAPLLGLFGEKFAQQFLAESFTFWDHILFAMAPLGILTAIVGAIRVDGANWLKQLIGRARETTASAEIELMSSVSQEVCEVWNGTSIVRSMGAPQVKQIIHLPAKEGDFSPESFITMDRKTWSRDYELKAECWSTKDIGSEKISTNEDSNVDIESGHNINMVHSLGDEELIKNKEIPPNISLNIHGGSNPVELVLYALFASILQAGVLGWSSYAHKHALSGSNSLVGLLLQATGTVLLTLGLVLCAGIIDNGSRERHWLIEGERQVENMSELLSLAKVKSLANKLGLAKDKSLLEEKQFRRHMQLYWVQKQHIAGDNRFDPYILYAEELKYKVHESHRANEDGQNDRDDNAHESPRAKKNVQNDRRDKFLKELLRLFGHHLTTIAVAIGVLGFVAQFQGLRFSHWSCSIAQLIALGFATILRAWVRRTMTKTPVAVPAHNDYILAHLTLAIVGRDRTDSKFPHHDAFRSPGLLLRFGISTCPKLRVITEEPTNSESPSTTNVQASTEAGRKSNLTEEPTHLESPSTTNEHVLTEAERNPSLTEERTHTESPSNTNVQDSTDAGRNPNIIEEPTYLQSLPTTNVHDPIEAEMNPNLAEEPTHSESPSTTNVQDSKRGETNLKLAQEALNLMVRLGRLMKWTGAKSQEAIVLSNSIETALRKLSPRLPEKFGKKFAVVLRVDIYLPSTSKPDSQEEVELSIIKDGDVWKVDDGQLEALLSLVSYSVWAAKQNKRSEAETDRGEILPHSGSSAHLTKESNLEDSQTIGWLRTKAQDSRIYDIIVGTSSPRLTSDLRWWVSDTEQDLKKAKFDHTGSVTRVLADFIGPLTEAEANDVRPALGFYVNEKNSEENGMATIQRHVWRALTSTDVYCSWECDERKVSILHIFSTFIWAIAPYLSASQFHPTTVIFPKSRSERLTKSGLEEAHLQSDKIETLVQRLQSTGLGTYGEIYKVFIPPLSHFGKLPNEAVADWCNEILIEREKRCSWAATYEGYNLLLDMVRDREAQDRFSHRVAAMFVEFLLRVKEEPYPFAQECSFKEFEEFNESLRRRFENKPLLKAILSVNDILALRLHQSPDECTQLILGGLGVENTLGETQSQDLSLDGLCSSDNTSETERFSFPNDTDVFGWTEEYWDIFETPGFVPALRFIECSALDLAGRSVLHHKLDIERYPDYNGEEDTACFLFADRNHLGDSSIFVALCNKQTPLHRAALVDHLGVINELLAQGIDPNAGDHYGRTALCLAVFYGYGEVVRKLVHSMSSAGRDQKDNDNRNALHYAISGKQEDLAIFLIRRGIDINAEDIFGKQPLWYAGLSNMDSLVDSLLETDGIHRPVMVWRPENGAYSDEEWECLYKLRARKDVITKWKNPHATREELEFDPNTGKLRYPATVFEEYSIPMVNRITDPVISETNYAPPEDSPCEVQKNTRQQQTLSYSTPLMDVIRDT
ncbi:hypothetical protein JMJ35_003388 [Cladonia borealis]|uniref:Ankyrin repeat protein n=1 Tax=Cladonia borealis TaxID=184061 RepID=A0AA39R642_9LECA|nr:hypothetical protein JMJ35_003388 [Cladonia borealis]